MLIEIYNYEEKDIFEDYNCPIEKTELEAQRLANTLYYEANPLFIGALRRRLNQLYKENHKDE